MDVKKTAVIKTAKKAVFKKFTKVRTLPLKQHYVRLNQKYKRLSKSDFRHYQRGIQSKLKTNPKLFWNYVNEQRKKYGLPSSMVLDGVTVPFIFHKTLTICFLMIGNNR